MEGASADQARTNQGLAIMVARAHRWRELLKAGPSASVREFALAVALDNSDPARMLRLTLLATGPVGAIVNGTEPDGISSKRLYRAPRPWEEQRRALGAR